MSTRMANPVTEPHITFVERTWVIPKELQAIAVQNDKNSETVYIDIPRFFDGIDREGYEVYMRTVSDEGGMDEFKFEPDHLETQSDVIVARWELKPPQTTYSGPLRAFITLRSSDYQWTSHEGLFTIKELIEAELAVPATPSIYDMWLKKITDTADEADADAKDAIAAANAAAASASQAKASSESATSSASSATSSASTAKSYSNTAKTNSDSASASATKAAQDRAYIEQFRGDMDSNMAELREMMEDTMALASSLPKFNIEVVSSLPNTNVSPTTIYLVTGGDGTDMYTEYIYVNGKWEILGVQGGEVSIDGYATEVWVMNQLQGYLLSSELTNAINTALAQAKASGEFDGKDGTSVSISNINQNTSDGGTSTVTFSDGKVLSIKNGSKGSNGTSVTITKVTESSTDGGSNVVTFSDGKTLSVKNGSKGTDGTSVTVTNVSESTVDGGTNTVTFSNGKKVSIKNGSKGKDGDHGVPAIVKSITKNGTITTVVIEDFNGETSFEISDGTNGKNGTSVTVSGVSESTADGGTNVVTFSDGKKLNVKNGSKGTSGKDGTSVTITNVEESAASGGENVVTFSDGKTLTVKNGKDGTGGGGNGSADWSVNDPDASGYVKNRTHWTEGTSEVLLVSGKQVTASNGYISDTELLTVGTEYRVLYDGTEYHFTASEYTDNAGRKYVYCGNSVILSGNYDDSIWDDWFVIFNFNGRTFVKDVLIEKGFSTSATISVYGIIETVHKLDEKYIPDTIARKSDITGGGSGGSSAPADWSVNDPSAPGYVKNRTHWVESREAEIVPPTELVLNEELGIFIVAESEILTEGATYRVSWDGVEYERTAQRFVSSDGENIIDLLYVGNAMAVGLDDTGEPFLIVHIDGFTVAMDVTGELTAVTIGIKGAIETVHKLPEKYLPGLPKNLVINCDTSTHNFSLNDIWDASERDIKDSLSVVYGGAHWPALSVAKQVVDFDVLKYNVLQVRAVVELDRREISTIELAITSMTSDVAIINTDKGSLVENPTQSHTGKDEYLLYGYHLEESAMLPHWFSTKQLGFDRITLLSPSGKRFSVTVDDDGKLTTTHVNASGNPV